MFFKKTKVNAGADVGMLRILESVTYKPAQAIAEYVDNSVQSYLDYKKDLLKINSNYKLKIDIVIDKNTITITDNAAGISDEKFNYALKTAAIPELPKKKKNHKSLNEFGMGMKAASYWFTRTWSIETKFIHEKKRKTVNLNREEVIASNGEVEVDTVTDTSKKSGTIITLKNIRQAIVRHSAIIEDLASIHRKFLSKEIIITYTYAKKKETITWERPTFRYEPPYLLYQKWINENKNNLNSPAAKKIKPKTMEWKIPVDFVCGIDSEIHVRGYVAKMDQQLKAISGLYYFRTGKLLEGPIFPNEIFARGYDGSSTANAIYGELDFKGADAVFTKNMLNMTERDRQDLEMKLKKLLRNEINGSNLLSQLKVPNINFNELYQQEKLLSEGKIKGEDLEDLKASQKYHGIDAANKAIKKNENNPIFSKPSTKALPKFQGQIVYNDPIKGIKIGNKKYTFKLEQTWAEKSSNPWLDYVVDDTKKEITIRIAMAHPFFSHYFMSGKRNDITQGIKLLGQYIVNAEVTAIEEGIKRSKVVRENVNKILNELPPIVGREDKGKKD